MSRGIYSFYDVIINYLKVTFIARALIYLLNSFRSDHARRPCLNNFVASWLHSGHRRLWLLSHLSTHSTWKR